MNKKTTLQNLLFQSGLTIQQFADKIGVKKSAFEKQLQNKEKHIYYAHKYAIILGVNEIKGHSLGCYVEFGW